MSSKLKKRKRRNRRMNQLVFIIMPTPLNHIVDVRSAQFCTQAVAKGIAHWEAMPSRAAEDGRNRMLRKMGTDYSHVFFLDADSFPYDQFAIERLLHHNKPVVAGITPTQRSPKTPGGKIMKNWNVVTKNDGQLHIIKRSEKLPSGLFKAEYVGGTGILIRRDVIQKLNQPYMMTQRNEQGDIVKSEDYDFCDKVRDAGYDIWIDPEVKFGHQQSIDIGIYG